MDVEPHEAGTAAQRLAGVHTHSHLDHPGPFMRTQCPLAFDRCEQRVACAREGIEEAVTSRVDLGAVSRSERLAQQTALVSENLLVSVSELAQQAGRTLDIGEEEGDRTRC